MSFAWFLRRSGAKSPSQNPTAVGPDLLETARALAKEGKQEQAADTYSKIKRKHRTVPGLIEHAQLLIELGDYFGAAAMASHALELEPDNARAKAIQTRIQKADDDAQKKPAR